MFSELLKILVIVWWQIHYGYFYSISTQRRSRLHHWYCVRVNMPKCYRQLQSINQKKLIVTKSSQCTVTVNKRH